MAFDSNFEMKTPTDWCPFVYPQNRPDATTMVVAVIVASVVASRNRASSLKASNNSSNISFRYPL